MFLEFFEPFVVELVFIPVVLGEELVEGSLTLGWENFSCNPCHRLAAGSSKTGNIGLGMVLLVGR